MKLIIYINKAPTYTDQKIEKISRYFGVKTEYIETDKLNINEDKLNISIAKECCFAMSMETFVLFSQKPESKNFMKKGSNYFIYPERHKGTHREFLNFTGLDLSLGILQGKKIKFHNAKINGELSSLLLKTTSRNKYFSLNSNTYVKTIIDVDDNPTFFMKQLNESKLYISGFSVVDIEKTALGPIILKDEIDGYIPFLIYLKDKLKNKMWCNNKNYANLIIDDPHLKKKYGYIDFKQLVQETFKNKFKVTVGFVPINYKKINDSTVELFKSSGNMGLCVHGCTHTSKEFAGNKYERLVLKAQASKYLMNIVQLRTGINPVMCMVFPQGYFSSDSLRALKRTNYIAAINSHFNINSAKNDGCSFLLKDFLTPAVVSIYGFPVFHRRIPNSEAIHFRLSAFLGKPIFLVQHHQDFRKGYDKLKEAIKKIETVVPALQWASLENILKQSYWKKANDDGSISIRLFSRKAIVTNEENNKRKHKIFFIEKNADDLDFKIRIDGKPIIFKTDGERVKFEIDIEPKQNSEIAIIYEGKNQKKLRIDKKEMFASVLRGFFSDMQATLQPIFKPSESKARDGKYFKQ